MRRNTLTALLLGAWLAGTLFMWAVATQNFRLVDRILAAPAPELTTRTAPLAPGEARLLMRYQASEVNRLFFDRWGWAQLGIGIIVAVLVFSDGADRPLRIAVTLMLVLAAALQLGVVPETIRLGRLLDFAPRSPDGAASGPEAAFFWRLHTAYTALDMLKFLLGVFSTVRVMKGGRS